MGPVGNADTDRLTHCIGGYIMVEKVRTREADFKEQAKRLRAYLAIGGYELKHRNAMEAVAQMHGAKDWHTLISEGETEATATTSHAGDAPKVDPCLDLYGVQITLPSHSHTAISPSRELAVLGFIQSARTVVDLFGGDDHQVMVIGQDVDDGMPKLALAINGSVIVTLFCPSRLTNTVIKKQPDGNYQSVPGKKVNLFGVDHNESSYAIAVALNDAFASRKKSEEKPRQQLAINSFIARYAVMDDFDVMSEQAVQTHQEESWKPMDVDPRELLLAIDKVSVSEIVRAVIR
jgi:hypothetical protein